MSMRTLLTITLATTSWIVPLLRTYAQVSLAAVPGTVFEYPKGQIKLGENTAWTENRLKCSVTLYDKNPNNSKPPWSRVVLDLRDGTTLSGTCIETFRKRNFISVIREGERRVSWIPFEAIVSVTFEKPRSLGLRQFSTQGDIYQLFWFRYGTPIRADKPLEAPALIKLRHPLENGSSIVRGWLLDEHHDLTMFTSEGEEKVPWLKMLELRIEHPPGSNLAESRPVTAAKFVYRGTEQWANVWNEYRIPSEDEPTK